MPITDERLYEVAERVRQEFLAGEAPLGFIASLCGDAIPRIRKSARVMAVYPPEFPYHYCEFTSVYINFKIGKIGRPEVGLYGMRPHTVLSVGTYALSGADRIVDITADQFGGPEVYVGPLVEPWKLRREIRV